jgi:hypothetical protein
MSDAFDTNLLSQVTALDRKLSINKERMNLTRNPKHHEHKKGGNSPPEGQPAGMASRAESAGTARGDPGKIDITI